MRLVSRVWVSLALMLVVVVVSPNLAWAQSSQDTINVTATVAPPASSISTQLSVSPTHSEFSQNQVLTYTITYTSSNASAVPLQLQAQWAKGTVEGASEANVELLSYVVGSATQAYGSTPAVVDTLNRKITWDIGSLPAGLGPQTVTFQLVTSSSYTGSLIVTAPVTAVVLLPAGVSDKTSTVSYRYAGSTTSSSATTQAPSLTNLTRRTTSPSPSPSPSSAQKRLTAVLVRAVGKTSAKVTVLANAPVSVDVVYGDSVQDLESTVTSSAQKAEQIFYLTNLAPNTQHYFQVQPEASENIAESDIYTFKTASADSATTERKASGLTVSQDRSVIFSGDISGDDGQPISSMTAAKDSVIDLNVHIDDHNEILSFEAEIRSSTVLGMTTNAVNGDDFQSQTTQMTKIGDGVYVGKLRTPVNAGRFQLVSRIEDIYGNLSETEFGSLKVIEPMVILRAGSNKPIEHARVNLLVYNQQTTLFETLSNVTTSIANPTYSDKDGIVKLNLYPATYKAEISAPGYESQTVEFNVAAEDATQFPRVILQPNGWGWLLPLGFLSDTAQAAGQSLWAHYMARSESQSLYNAFVLSHLLLMVVLVIRLWWQRRSRLQPNPVIPQLNAKSKYLKLIIFISKEVGKFIINIYLLNSLIISFFYFNGLDWLQGGFLLLSTVILIILWIVTVWRNQTSRT